MTKRPGWRSIAADLRDAIQRGELLPGAKLPGQEELAERYGVARLTVQRALTVLADEGLVISEKTRGTWVRQPPVRLSVTRYSAVVDPDRPRNDLGPWETACAQHGINGRAELVETVAEQAPGDVAERLRVAPGSEVVRRNRRMWANDDVVQVQNAWYPADIAAATGLDSPTKVVGGVYAQLSRSGVRPGWASEEISARLPAQAEVDSMDVRGGQPVLEVWRTTHDADGRPIEVVHIVAVAASVTLTYEHLPITVPEKRESSSGASEPRSR